MYSYIQGKLAEINPAYAVIDTHGVGYLLHISVNTYGRIGKAENCKLYTHLVVREDAQLLYGFADETERGMFRQLISVSGIGPNTAILILSSLTPDELSIAITSSQVDVLKAVKGIGAKTAQRVIVDLKDKLDSSDPALQKLGILHNTKKEEALSGLVVLGFNKKIAERALDKIIRTEESGTDPLTVEQLIKEALKAL